MDGAIFFFFRSPLSVGVCRFVLVSCFILSALAASSFRSGCSDVFFLSPDSLLPALLCLLASYSPPPPGVGCAGVVPVCRLRVSVRFACVARVPCRSLTAFVRYCLVIAPLLFFSLRPRCLPSRWRCHLVGCPRPSSVLVLARHPLSV